MISISPTGAMKGLLEPRRVKLFFGRALRSIFPLGRIGNSAICSCKLEPYKAVGSAAADHANERYRYCDQAWESHRQLVPQFHQL